MVQLYLRCRQVICIDAKIGSEESLNIAFSFNAAAHGRILFISFGYKFQCRSPFTVKSHVIEEYLYIYQIDIVVVLIFFQDIFIILFSDICIRDS